MNILKSKKFIISSFGKTYRVGVLLLVFAFVFHFILDMRSEVKSNFRIIGSYVR